MARWSFGVALLSLLASGCLAGPGDAGGADDGRLAWLLPTDNEIPEGWDLAMQDPQWLATPGQNPGAPSEEVLAVAAAAGGNDAVPQDAVAAVYARGFDATQRVTVLAMRFAGAQQAEHWRAWPGWGAAMAASEEAQDDDEEGWAVFVSVCGLRPYYGFVRGADVVLVLGSDWGDGQAADAVYRAALDLTEALQRRAQGAGICDDGELARAREMAGEEVLGREDGNDVREGAPILAEHMVEAAFEKPGDADWYRVDDQGEARICVWTYAEHDQEVEVLAFGPDGPVPITWTTDDSTYPGFATQPGPIDLKVSLKDAGAVAEVYRIALHGSSYCD